MGSPTNLDVFAMGRILEAILRANIRESESAIQGAANVNWGLYTEYRDVLLQSGDIAWSTRASDGRRVPCITKEGLETLAQCRRIAARWGKENVVVEEIRARAAEKRRAKRATPSLDAREDSG